MGEGDLGTRLLGTIENVPAAQGEDIKCCYHWKRVNRLLKARVVNL